MDPSTIPGAPAPRKTSPWVYVAWGCAAVLVLGVGACFAFGYFVAQQAKQIQAGFKDPKAREAKTRELLHYRELPEGYYPMGGISVPLVVDAAFLSDTPPQPGNNELGAMGGRAFVYMKMRAGKLTPAARQGFLNGNRQQTTWMRNFGVTVNAAQELGRGTVQAGGATLFYFSQRGVTVGHGRSTDSVATNMVIECPDQQIRFAVWSVPDPAAGQAGSSSSTDLAGTPADPKALEAFANHFEFCQ